MKYIALILGFLLLAGGVSEAGTMLKETPVQSRMQAELMTPVSTVQPVSGYRMLGSRQGGLDYRDGDSREEPKSIQKTILYSALLPGLGEYYVGNRKKARYFFAVEALSWIGLISFRTYSGWKEDDYISFAAEKAGADLEGKSDDFRDWVGFYDDIDQYNTLGRVLESSRPYLEDNASNHWRWQTLADKNAYREIKNRSKEADRRADFMIGLMVLNRIVSVIDAVRDVRKSHKLFGDSSEEDGPGKIRCRLDIDPFNAYRPLSFSVYTRF